MDGRNDLKLELLRTFALTKGELNGTISSIKFILRAGGGRESDAQMNDAQIVSQEAGMKMKTLKEKYLRPGRKITDQFVLATVLAIPIMVAA